MLKKTKLKIITPHGLFYDKEIEMVTVKTSEGYIGLQHGKSPFVASIAISELHLGAPENKICSIAGGLVYVTTEGVDIITDAVEYKDKIDLARAERAKKHAEDELKHKLGESEKMQAELALLRSINRIKTRRH
ncbi:MAG: ATP synthase F1 subunit epsilon [Mycoplasmataceae bacterium]|nr:ATP synthase F1 subunit epsilon [Mycoplasmataceae bacterium]